MNEEEFNLSEKQLDNYLGKAFMLGVILTLGALGLIGVIIWTLI